MTIERTLNEIAELRQQRSKSFGLVAMFLLSILAGFGVGLTETTTDEVRYSLSEKAIVPLSVQVQIPDQGGQGSWDGGMGETYGPDGHPALYDVQYTDPMVAFGKVEDLSLLDLRSQNHGIFLEETNGKDHDNDGIQDLDDLDDDNDGIYDLLERFDGCAATDPYDHDNDGILDIDDLDDDNDGILEGPIDYEDLESKGYDPRNVSTDRFIVASTIHPWTNTAVGNNYLADQMPMDHDNDGVTDEDNDGSGAGRYDEDDDNDGRIDQFKWPCDFDSDGTQDYFDDDDDGDGVLDVSDADPYNDSVTTTITYPGDSGQRQWSLNEYRDYSGGLDFVTLEASRTPNPSFTAIFDGDLDGDGVPNFLDPDTDDDGLPNSADTDDDNDGILDMVDPDDDNDGIADTCIKIDTNGDGKNDYTGLNDSNFQTPGSNTDGIAGIDCEVDYDADADNDRWRPFDTNYNGIWDWLDTDLGGTPTPDDFTNTQFNALDLPYDTDNDNIDNENDSFPLDESATVATWNCPTAANPNPVNPDPRCETRRASFSNFNDWDGDGINNWDDVDDDNDGIVDYLDIDWDCDLDNDNDLHSMNGSKYRDDGPNLLDSDIDGDGLENDMDWDDDNDGINDLYDPDDGNCGIVDYDQTDAFYTPWYPIGDGEATDGTRDGGAGGNYVANATDHWNLVFLVNPFAEVELDYNGYDSTTNPLTPGTVPEFYFYFLARWSPWNGGNEWDIDSDGDSLQNGLDVDQDADGLPDYWDQDEGNDGVLDVDDIKMGGTLNNQDCGWTAGSLGTGWTCGWAYAIAYHMPMNGASAQFGAPYSTRPDSTFNQGGFQHSTNASLSCASSCYQFQLGGTTLSAVSYSEMEDNTDMFLTWLGTTAGLWTWNFDANADDFPDEVGADFLKNDVDGDSDGDGGTSMQSNNTIDIDDDYDAVFDWYDVDDDNDGIWDYFEIDSDDDWDNDDGQDNGNFFTGTNCIDNDDDGNDADVDEDGWYQAVWDRGQMSQGLYVPRFYDVDNDNDGVPDAEDFDDDNNGVSDIVQESTIGCFFGEEQSPWDHVNDGILNWMDDDWDGDGISNTVELAGATPFVSAWDHDNDGERDDIDPDDDADGMHDEDEVLLWPLRFARNSTNPWDHDDYGDGEGIANPLDDHTGPDAVDMDDDNDTWEDTDYDVLEEGQVCERLDAQGNPTGVTEPASDWDHDNDCLLDDDDKPPTYITMDLPENLWLDAMRPAVFKGHVTWLNPSTGVLENASELPVQVHIEWASNNTTALETIDVLTNVNGNFTVGQFILPETIDVGPNSTYEVYAVVTEMFAFNGSRSQTYTIGAEANLTVDFAAWNYFRSDEQPLWLDFKAHYTADWTRGLFDNRIAHAPITFEMSGGPFGNVTHPTNFTGFGGKGYRTDSDGWCSLTFIQDLGASGAWKQVRWNSTMDNGVGQIPGGYEEIIWDDINKKHNVAIDSQGDPVRYNYTNTSLPYGDLEITAHVDPTLGDTSSPDEENWEWPFPWMHGDSTDVFTVRVMHRMNIEGKVTVAGTNPIYWWNASINNQDGTYGSWSSLWNEQALEKANIAYNDAKAGKAWPLLWSGNPLDLNDEAETLRQFIDADEDNWYISLTNGGDADLPPCGKINPSDPDSGTRCEIIPEINTGEVVRVDGDVSNRTGSPWTDGTITMQVDIDHNDVFQGTRETAYVTTPSLEGGKAVYDYNWTWFTEYAAGTYGMKVDFVNSDFFFTGNSSVLAKTGGYINVTVVGTTDFQLTSVPRLYRNSSSVISARLVDNALQPVQGVPVNWNWSGGLAGVNHTDERGLFSIEFNVSADDDLGNSMLQFEFEGMELLLGNSAQQEIWIVSHTHLSIVQTSPNVRGSGDLWDFTAQITDDNKTAIRDSGGQALSGATAPSGGLVDVIFEGLAFDNTYRRQVVATLAPSAGILSLPEPASDNSHLCVFDGDGDGRPDRDANEDDILDRNETVGCLKSNFLPLDPELLREDPTSFLPDGFGPVNVYLRFEEALPNEGCALMQPQYLGLQGKWDPCQDIQGSDHYRRVLPYNGNGFSLIGNTQLLVDNQIVYTSEFDVSQNEVVEKPMTVTGHLSDEMGTNLSKRQIRVSYEMINSPDGPIACIPSITDDFGYYTIECPLSGVNAGTAQVTVTYNAYDNNDAYRYLNKSVTVNFEVFSNSTLSISEIGPFKNSYEQWPSLEEANGGERFDVLYLKESFHIDAELIQSNGQAIGGKCLNIYIDPDKNTRPFARIYTDDATGTIEWFSANPQHNPSLKGIEPSSGEYEGFRTIRVAYEPDKNTNVGTGCQAEVSSVVNGSYMDKVVLVKSRVSMYPKEIWAGGSDGGFYEGEIVSGQVALLRDRTGLAVENEDVIFTREYWDQEAGGWVQAGMNLSKTNEQGIASFMWPFTGTTCAGASCEGKWRITASFDGSQYFSETADNITFEITTVGKSLTEQQSGFFSKETGFALAILVLTLAIVGTLWYKRAMDRKRIEMLRGILSDTMMQLRAANEYIAVIFNCYKDLVKHFRRYGFMKKVYETTREFESAVRSAFSMVPPEQLDDFLAIFEEARYSDHDIGPTHRDRALQTLQAITASLTMALGDTGQILRTEEHAAGLYEEQVKAGSFTDAEGKTIIQGQQDDQTDFKI